MKMVELRPIKESTEDFESIEKQIKAIFRDMIYHPIMRELGYQPKTLKNADDSEKLLDAIRTGQITYYRGTFSGRFNATTSKELKRLGAKWDKKTGTFKLVQSSLPIEVKTVISSSESQFKKKLDLIDKQLAQVVPEQVADKLKCVDAFDRTLWKVERDFRASVKGITIAPELSPEQRRRLSTEWEKNLQLYIKDFTEKEIGELRGKVKEAAFSGDRYGSAIKTIQESYGVSANKAKFLARQETSLLMTKYKQTRYEDAGVNEYKWGCVTGTALHPVRPAHKKLEGKIFRWDDPPIVDDKGNRKNPGQDYNCRCFAKPIARFKK